MEDKKVVIVMGSDSDYNIVKAAEEVLSSFDISYESRILSAHRTPEEVTKLATTAKDKGVKVFIAAAGKAAHLAGVIAAHTTLPVIGLPIKSSTLDGLDALLSTVQMPKGIPVATVAIDGAENAAILAAEILSLDDPELSLKLEQRRKNMKEDILIKDKSLRESCGLFGVYSKKKINVGALIYHGLYAQQHRGQESCGIAINRDKIISGIKDVGLISDVFTKEVLDNLPEGEMAIGHCNYGSVAKNNKANAQPMIIRHIKGNMAIGHNGALTNSVVLKRELELSGAIFHSDSDSEIISYIITKERLKTDSIEEAITLAIDKLKGAFSLVIMSDEKLIAVRDPNGFRPLCIGKSNGSIIVASESCALDSVGAEFTRDIMPGEIVVIDDNGIRSIDVHSKPFLEDSKKNTSFCIFEYIYFARPDSVIDKCSVHAARRKAGEFLAMDYPVDADVVIGVPDTGIDAAIGYAKQSKIPYDMGLLKNKYIGRTFIEPSKELREKVLRIKLNAISEVVEGKRIVLIDDSIVRGTTSKRIVNMLREVGAKEVHLRVSAPPFMHPCYFGTDIRSAESLIAANYSVEDMKKIIGADSLGFLSTERIDFLASESKLGFCKACFTGNYPVKIDY